MLDLNSAKRIVLKNLPGGKIEKYIEYKGLFVFQVIFGDPSERGFDPYYSVERSTGKFSGFPIMLPEYFSEVMSLFEKVTKR